VPIVGAHAALGYKRGMASVEARACRFAQGSSSSRTTA
jgi:hypothetical protein